MGLRNGQGKGERVGKGRKGRERREKNKGWRVRKGRRRRGEEGGRQEGREEGGKDEEEEEERTDEGVRGEEGSSMFPKRLSKQVYPNSHTRQPVKDPLFSFIQGRFPLAPPFVDSPCVRDG